MKKINYLSMVFMLSITIYSCTKEKIPCHSMTINPPEFLADTTPMKRVAVLEEISGVRCWWTPTGHQISKEILKTNPGKIILVSIHASSFASAQVKWPNYTCVQGNAIYGLAKQGGIPAAALNRMTCAELGLNPMSSQSQYFIDRANWSKATGAVMTLSAPVNLGTSALFDPVTRILNVKVDIYYTANESIPNNLNIMLLQDKIIGKQNSQNIILDNYEQNNVLRDMITTGNWGETIALTTQRGTKITRRFQYYVPLFYNGGTAEGGGPVVIDDLKVVAFISRGQLEILNAVQAEVE